MWTFADVESQPRLPKLIKLFDSLILPYQILENGKRFGPALGRHPGEIRGTDHAHYVSDLNAFTRYISAL